MFNLIKLFINILNKRKENMSGKAEFQNIQPVKRSIEEPKSELPLESQRGTEKTVSVAPRSFSSPPPSPSTVSSDESRLSCLLDKLVENQSKSKKNSSKSNSQRLARGKWKDSPAYKMQQDRRARTSSCFSRCISGIMTSIRSVSSDFYQRKACRKIYIE